MTNETLKCNEERREAFIAGTLPEDEHCKFHAHLDECDNCFEAVYGREAI
jgi:hypothetical protein